MPGLKANSTQADMILRDLFRRGEPSAGLKQPNQSAFPPLTGGEPYQPFGVLPGTAVTSDRMRELLKALRDRQANKAGNLLKNFG